jgi:hypothetical protein
MRFSNEIAHFTPSKLRFETRSKVGRSVVPSAMRVFCWIYPSDLAVVEPLVPGKPANNDCSRAICAIVGVRPVAHQLASTILVLGQTVLRSSTTWLEWREYRRYPGAWVGPATTQGRWSPTDSSCAGSKSALVGGKGGANAPVSEPKSSGTTIA